ncbi:ISNCY family transposase [Bacteroides heparinolyticus]|uniref:ISNCY family transposase n=1 Tax=Prevotella heparinolytica TaxID=28113 RepID=UPI00359FE04A
MDEHMKYEIIKSLADHPESGNKERAALKIGCTKRHVNRMLKGYKQQGKDFFVHGNRGRKPATTIPENVRNSVIDLYRTKYYEANFEHYTELLARNEKIVLSASTVMNILESAFILSPKATRAKKKRMKRQLEIRKKMAKTQKEQVMIRRNLVAVEDAHSRRPRCAYFGELQQMDATPYEWVPGQVWHLHLAIDDATGRITGAWFDTEETLKAYYQVFSQILKEYGIPFKFLTDKRTVFTYTKKDAPSDDEDTYTQFAYACKQLGVELESTSVPQAKGRVERLNQTLQSRLPVELRLAGVTELNKANEFLYSYIQKFNGKFSLPIHGIKSVFEAQPSEEKINLTLAVLAERTVDSGHAVQFRKQHYRMVDKNGIQMHYAKGTKVIVIQALDGGLFTCVNDHDIYALELIPTHEELSKNFDNYKKQAPQKQYIPPMNHPWRRSLFKKHVISQTHRIKQNLRSA